MVASPAPLPAQRAVPFPSPEELRLGEPIEFFNVTDGVIACSELRLRDSVVAAVAAFFHMGTQAIVQRCIGDSWDDPDAPSAEEIARRDFDAMIEGSKRFAYDTLIVADAVSFAVVNFPRMWGDLSVSGSTVAYFGMENRRETPEGDTVVDALAIIYDFEARATLQERRLGTCLLVQYATDYVYLPGSPAWTSDGTTVRFVPSSDSCDFGEVALPAH